jgi:hypothetical protein
MEQGFELAKKRAQKESDVINAAAARILKGRVVGRGNKMGDAGADAAGFADVLNQACLDILEEKKRGTHSKDVDDERAALAFVAHDTDLERSQEA